MPRTDVGSVPVEVARAHAARFLRPLLFVHGLWTGGWIWQLLAGYLAHRGWESWAPSLLDAPGVADDHAAIVDSLRALAGTLPAPPIVVAHDAGVVPAAWLAAAIGAPALVAVAPVVPPADGLGAAGLFGWPRFWRARLLGGRLVPPRAPTLGLRGGDVERIAPRLRPDSARRFRALAGGRERLPATLACPTLVVTGEGDPLATTALGETLAAHRGWDHRAYAGRGHFPMLEEGWENVAADVHRWLVTTVGAELLAFLDDEDDA